MPTFTHTVRFRLTVWYSGLLLVFGVAFVVALNIAVRLDQPDILTLEDPTITYVPIRSGPGQATTGLSPVTTYSLKQTENQIFSTNMDRLRNWSIIAVVGLAMASGVGGYVLSGMMLQPVREITQVASEIGVTNLSRRINRQGPDDELKALSDTFDSMVDRLEHSFDQQRQFVQDASHELRTPLAAIRTNIEVTEMDPDVSAEEYRRLLETVKTQTARLTRLSEDLLLLTTNEREDPLLEPVPLVGLGRQVIRELGPLAAAKGVSLATEGDTTLEATANMDLLYRCVFNLTDNAIKYSGEGAHVTIAATRQGGDVLLKVADTGPGIEPEQLALIFDRFYRVDKGRSRREGGIGLGLSIVKELMHSMNGSVSVDSTPGAGSSFTLRLPIATDEPAAQPSERWVLGHA
ncbi:MAG: HAMP domain-containing histidine kinase [Chloroflexi bacterium]|nr:HAMP domain-containing histidine kinase [Chloroflexota bacterium]